MDKGLRTVRLSVPQSVTVPHLGHNKIIATCHNDCDSRRRFTWEAERKAYFCNSCGRNLKVIYYTEVSDYATPKTG